MDPMDHEADSGHNNDHAIPRAEGEDMARVKNYMRGMNALGSGTSKTAGQYGAESAQSAYDYTRKLVGLE